MDPLIELSELAKARIEAKEAEAEEVFDRVRQACDGDIAAVRRTWGGYLNLHQSKIPDAIETARGILDEANTMRARYVFAAHAAEYSPSFVNPGELEPLLSNLREAVVKQFGELTRLPVQSQETIEMKKAWEKRGAMDDQPSKSSGGKASTGYPNRPGDPLFENPFPVEHSGHSILATYFEMAQEFRKLAEEYPDLTMKWIASNGEWRSWPPSNRAYGGVAEIPTAPGADLHIRRIASDAAQQLLHFSGSGRVEALRKWFNHGRDRWLDSEEFEACDLWFYAIREFWLSAREQAEAGKIEMSLLQTIREQEGYSETGTHAIGRRVWSLMVTERKSLWRVLKEKQLPDGSEINSYEEAVGHIEEGRINHVFIASAYFCGVVAARRAKELEADLAGLTPVDFVSSQSADFWRARRSEFNGLLSQQAAVLGTPNDPKWLSAFCRFSKGAFDSNKREGGLDGQFLSEFDEIATQAACALSLPKDVDPVKHWIYCLGLDLAKSPEPAIRNQLMGELARGGLIRRLLEASVGYCSRLAARAERDGTASRTRGNTTPPAGNVAETKSLELAKRSGIRTPSRRNERYHTIDKALRQISESRPSTQEEIFQSLDGRSVVIPPAEPFLAARGWLSGFRRDQVAARAWLSKRWTKLNLPPLPRGPKNAKE